MVTSHATPGQSEAFGSCEVGYLQAGNRVRNFPPRAPCAFPFHLVFLAQFAVFEIGKLGEFFINAHNTEQKI